MSLPSKCPTCGRQTFYLNVDELYTKIRMLCVEPLTTQQIADAFQFNPSTIRWHLLGMRAEGKIFSQRKGRATYWGYPKNETAS